MENLGSQTYNLRSNTKPSKKVTEDVSLGATNEVGLLEIDQTGVQNRRLHVIGQEDHPENMNKSFQMSDNETTVTEGTNLDNLAEMVQFRQWNLEHFYDKTKDTANQKEVGLGLSEKQTTHLTVSTPKHTNNEQSQQDILSLILLKLEEQSKKLELLSKKFDDQKEEFRKIRHETKIKIEEAKVELNQETDTKISNFKNKVENCFTVMDQKINEVGLSLNKKVENINYNMNLFREEICQKDSKFKDEVGEVVKAEVKRNLQRMQDEFISKEQFDLSMERIDNTDSVRNKEVVIAYQNLSELNPNNLPTFDGRTNNPMIFLNKLRAYVNRNERKFKISFTDLKEIIEGVLTGTAASWWQLNKDQVGSLQDFEEIFINKYWSKEVQRGLKQRIEYEKYRPGGKLSRTSYFIERAVLLKSMTINKPDEEEIVSILSEHFSQKIQDACAVQGIKTISAMERLLDREDNEERNRNLRSQNNPHTNKINNQQPHIQHKQTDTIGNETTGQNYRRDNYTPWQPKNPRHDYDSRQKQERQNTEKPHYKPSNYISEGRQHPKQSFYPSEEQKQVCTMIRQDSQRIPQNSLEEQHFNGPGDPEDWRP